MAARPPTLAQALLIAAAASTLVAAPATAQLLVLDPDANRRYDKFVALDVAGGVARNFETSRWLLLGAATAGLGFYNGQRFWTFGAGLRGLLRDDRAVIVTASRASVESGFGLHAGALWDLTRAAPGASAGVSVSVLTLQGDLVFDSSHTGYLSLFVRIPVGFLTYIALGGRR